MAKNRKGAETFFLGLIAKIIPGERNVTLYKNWFGSLSDAKFDRLMHRVRDSELILPVFAYNMDGTNIDHNKVMAIGERELGINYTQHLILTDPITGEEYKSVPKYFVLNEPVRRQIQHFAKGVSTPTSTDKVDQLTGQATGESKSTTMSMPELTVLEAKGHDAAITEMIKVRGGDADAFNHSSQQINETGSWSLAPIEELDSRPKITKVVEQAFLGMHLDNNVAG